MTKNKIDVRTLHQLLKYDPKTGKFWWRFRHRRWFKNDHDFNVWNARFAGKRALKTKLNGYLKGTVCRKHLYAHRVAFAMMYGFWPNEVDHQNGKRSDNRIVNLRSADRLKNSRNATRRSDNKSGFVGVSWNSSRRLWQAAITIKGVSIILGLFSSKKSAASARKNADVKYQFHKNHGKEAWGKP